jgi:hypothetical protein
MPTKSSDPNATAVFATRQGRLGSIAHQRVRGDNHVVEVHGERPVPARHRERFHGHAGRASVDDEDHRVLACRGRHHNEVGEVGIGDIVRSSG